MGNPDELVDVVDAAGLVLGTVTRREMRARNLRHRSVAIAVRSRDGRLLVHRRADDKDIWPGAWDLVVGGVVSAGEEWADAAVRELAEEVGIVGPTPVEVARGSYDGGGMSEVYVGYEVVWDGPIHFTDGEVAEARWVDGAELDELLATVTFIPDSLEIALPFVRR